MPRKPWIVVLAILSYATQRPPGLEAHIYPLDPGQKVCLKLLSNAPYSPRLGTDLAETQILRYAGTLVRQNFLNIHRAWHPILRQYHMDQETLDEWSRQVETGEAIKLGSHSSFFDSNGTTTMQN